MDTDSPSSSSIILSDPPQVPERAATPSTSSESNKEANNPRTVAKSTTAAMPKPVRFDSTIQSLISRPLPAFRRPSITSVGISPSATYNGRSKARRLSLSAMPSSAISYSNGVGLTFMPDDAAQWMQRSVSLHSPRSTVEEAVTSFDSTSPTTGNKLNALSDRLMTLIAGKSASEDGSPRSAPAAASPWSFPTIPAPSIDMSNLWGSGTSIFSSNKENLMEPEDQSGSGEDDFKNLRDNYKSPRLPIVLCHGLFGFSVIGPANFKPLQVSYWKGVREALEEVGAEVFIPAVPASANVETRARTLLDQIEEIYPGREINLVGHSMGGLDCRYLATHLETTFKVRSITTIATPHHGSTFADYMIHDVIGHKNIPALLSFAEMLRVPGGGNAFNNLTTHTMAQFNEDTPDNPDVAYYSVGARFKPGLMDVFRIPWSIIYEKEGDNDGMVSVESARWGTDMGVQEDVNHLDLVGWLGPRYIWKSWLGKPLSFKPISFYLTIADHLAKEGY